MIPHSSRATRSSSFLTTLTPNPKQSVYRYVDKKTFLNWGLTSDWLVEGPRKRRQSGAAFVGISEPKKETSAPSTPEPETEDPNASSEGYGEMTEGSIERMLVFLKNLGSQPEVELLGLGGVVGSATPQKSNGRKKDTQTVSLSPTTSSLNLTPCSSFIDVGSGYGKVVLHAKLSVKVQKAVGIEYVPQRAQMASDALDELKSGKLSFVSKDALALLREPSTKLLNGDATKYGKFDFSHVYMYDKVFSDPTTELLAKQLNESAETKVLISYQRFEQWQRCGLEAFQEVASLTMRTTGGQNFKAYVLVNTR